MFINKKFILASSSKSRFNILNNAKLSFVKQKPKCNEEIIKKRLKKENNRPEQIVKILAKEKAKSINLLNPTKMVVGCDTVVIFKNNIIDKVKDRKSAFNKIKKLSGKKHKIVSSVSVFKNKKEIWAHTEKTIVEIRKLTDKNIYNYIKTNGKEVFESAGCYKAESFGPTIIKNIKGDFFNVMGFPLFQFLDFLDKNK